MFAQGRIDSFLQPEIAPAGCHESDGNVLAQRRTDDGTIVQEIYQRANGTLSFVYYAWVGWRDAGNVVRSHGWHRIEADSSTVVDDLEVAREIAQSDSKGKGIEFSEWQPK